MFRKVLIANRGEIAVRVIRTLREMDIASVAVFSDADRGSLHVRMADEAEWVGPSPSSESYLRVDRILDAARKHGAEAIHPGYGFLSENADFAAACEAAGIVFIGPSAGSIRAMGSKTAARQMAIAAGAPVVPGAHQTLSGPAEARTFARQFGYPLLLKAVAGGGGKGMRRVDSDAELDSAFRDAASEAERSFKNGDLYVEKLDRTSAPYRNPVDGRSLRQYGPLRRAGMFHSAPSPEGNGRVSLSAGGRASRHARGHGRSGHPRGA